MAGSFAEAEEIMDGSRAIQRAPAPALATKVPMPSNRRDIVTGQRGAIETMQRVATIATLASRMESFQKVLNIIHPQVDHVFIYLDGYSVQPSFLADFDRVTVHRAEDVGNLHCSSRFLCLKDLSTPSVVVIVDDDIIYPMDYVDRLVGALQQLEGKAIVGVHGRMFVPPHQSYARHAATWPFTHQLTCLTHVHELGTGTSAFISSNFNVDPRKWTHTNMNDINVAIEAQRRGLPRIAIARPAGWLRPHSEHQPKSIWASTLIDDSEQSRYMRALLGLYV